MCGICGAVDRRRRIERNDLGRMAASLRHRGPDDEGYYFSPADTPVSAGLAFRRLAIIDLDTGNQPIANEDGTIWIVFNGEIYNFPELRDELEHRGHRFSTHTDTEVIVHLYEELGPACVERLNGMFALALWDERLEMLVLARDRFGEKPLYYAETPSGLIFGSELKALLHHPECPREIDRESLSQYLAFEYIPAPHSIVTGISKLPRGHVLTWRDGRVKKHRYWDLLFAPDDPSRTLDDYVEEFRALLWAAVRRRLLSDVPLGAFLSGGVDSSSVVAAMVDLSPADRVKTFSIGFSEHSFDESAHARKVARHFGTEHHEQIFTPRVMLDLLPTVAGFLDEPFADPSVLPTYLLSRFTREHVTVALGGDGSDELLAGYPTFAADRAASLYRLPRFAHGLIVRAADRLPISTDNFSFDFKVKRFLRGMPYPPDIRHAVWLGAFTPAEQMAILRDPVGDPWATVRRAAANAPAGDSIARASYLYVDGYLQDDILTKVDRASMACSLEVRAPFLDVELAGFLGRVPSNLKLRGIETKYLLKRAMDGRLPQGIAKRPKKGFGVPIAAWLQNELRETLQEELSPARVRAQGLFDSRETERLVREHLSNSRDNRKQLWTLLCFQLWYQNYVEQGRGSGRAVVDYAAAKR